MGLKNAKRRKKTYILKKIKVGLKTEIDFLKS